MGVPKTNTTCDIYHWENSPPSDPDAAGVGCFLQANYERRLEVGQGEAAGFRFTHTLLVDAVVDIRDDYDGGTLGTENDTVYIPDQDGTPFTVRFVERRGRGTDTDHKKVYLDRGIPTWPTDEL